MNIYSLSLLDKTVQVTPEGMRMLGGLLESEVTRDDPEWAAQRKRKRLQESS